MPATVDERVVQMRFDNAQFESGAKKTISTLEELKKQSDFKDVKKGIQNFNTDHMTEALDKVKVSFDALEVVGKRVLENLTDSMYGFVSKTVKSFTVAPIEQGFRKFSEKTVAVATLAGQGYQLSTINEQLEKLMWFSDETSYNFTDMVGNITKFTATGQELEPSVQAMEGIALWAATAGQNAATASRAMYQLSQAMSKGALKYDDYKSIQNASMDTVQFRERAAEAAVAVGTLTKAVDKEGQTIYKTTSLTAAANKEFTLSELFASDALSRTMWLSSDVMMDVFSGYSKGMETIRQYMEENGIDTFKSAIDEIQEKAYDLAKTHGISMDEALKELNLDIDMFSLNAAKAGQETRQWSDVMDATMDAVSSGWMRTFELIFGTQKEATEFFSSVVEGFWEIFALGGEGRNEMFSAAMDDNVTKVTNLLNEVGISADDLEATLEQMAENAGQNVGALKDNFGTLSEAIRQGELPAYYLHGAINKIIEAGKGVSEAVAPDDLVDKVKQLAHGDLGLDPQARKEMAETYGLTEKQINMIDGWMRTDKSEECQKRIHDYVLEQMELAGTLEEFTKGSGEFSEFTEEEIAKLNEANELTEHLDEVSGRVLIRETVLNVLESISKVLGAIRAGFEQAFGTAEERGKRLKRVLQIIHDVVEALKPSESALKGITNIVGALLGLVRKVASVLKPIVGIIGGVGMAIAEVVDRFFSLFDNTSEVFKEFSEATGFFEKLKVVLKPLGRVLDIVKEKFGEVWNKLQPIYDKIAGSQVMQSAISLLGSAVADVGSAFNSLVDSLKNTEINFDSVKGVFEQLGQVIGFIYTSLFGDPEELRKKISTFVDTFSNTLSEKLKDPELWGKIFEALKFGFVAAVLMKLAALLDSMKSLTETAKTWAESLKTPFVEMGNAIKRLSKAGTILLVAAAILALAGAIALLCQVDQDKFFNVALTLGILMVIMSKIAGKLGGMFSNNNFQGIKANVTVIPKLMGMLIGIAAVILAAVYALQKIKDINANDIVTGLITIASMLGIAVLALISVSKFSDELNVHSWLTLLSISVVIVAIGTAISSIGKINLGTALVGIIGIGVIIAAISLVLKSASKLKPEQIRELGTLFLKFGAAVALIGVAAKIMNGAGKGVVGAIAIMITMLTTMVIFTLVMSQINTDGIEKVATAMLILSAAILVISPALALLSLLNPGKVAAAALAVSLVMVAMAGALKMLEGSKPGVILATAAAFVLMAVGVSVLIAAVTGLIAIMLILAYTVPWSDVLANSKDMLKVFGKLALAGLALIPLAIVVTLVGAGIMMFGIGCAAAAVGVGIFTLNIFLFAASIYLVSAAIPKIADGISKLVEIISEHGSELFAITMFVIGLIVTAMLMKKVQVAEAAAQMVVSILNAISQLGPQLIPVIAGVLGILLTAILNFISPITEFLVMAIINLIDGLAGSLRSHEAELFGAFNAIVGTLTEIALKAIAQVLPMTFKFILLMLKNFASPLASLIEMLSGKSIDEMVDGINDKMETNKGKIDDIIDEVFMDENHKKSNVKVETTVDTEVKEGTTTGSAAPSVATTTERNDQKKEQLEMRKGSRTTQSSTAPVPTANPAEVKTSAETTIDEYTGAMQDYVASGSVEEINPGDILNLGEGPISLSGGTMDSLDNLKTSMGSFLTSGEGVSVDPASMFNFGSGDGTSLIDTTQFTEAFSGGGNAGIDSLLGVFKSRSPEVSAAASSMFDGVSESATSSGTAAGGNFVTGDTTALDNNKSTVKKKAGELVGEMKNGGGNAKNDGEGIGKNFAIGLNNGMNGFTNTLEETARNIMRRIKQAMSDEAEEKSPSKFTERVGRYLDEGLVIGMTKNATEVVTAAKDTMRGPLDYISEAMAQMMVLTDKDLDVQPTITPIVDMSNVASASNGIDTLFNSGTMNMGMNSVVSHRIDGITSAAITNNRNYTNDLQQLIAINTELLESSKAGGNVYLSDGVIAGMVNRRLGVL